MRSLRWISHRMSQSACIKDKVNLKSQFAPVKTEITVEKWVTALLILKTFSFLCFKQLSPMKYYTVSVWLELQFVCRVLRFRELYIPWRDKGNHNIPCTKLRYWKRFEMQWCLLFLAYFISGSIVFTMQSCIILFQSSPVTILKSTVIALPADEKFACLF